MQPKSQYDDPLVQAFQARLIAEFEAGKPSAEDDADRWHAWLTGLGAAVERVAAEEGAATALDLLAEFTRDLQLPAESPAHVRRAAAWYLADLAGVESGAAVRALRLLEPVLELHVPLARDVCRSAAEIALRAYADAPTNQRAEVASIARLAAARWLDVAIPEGDFLESWEGQIEEADALATVVLAEAPALEPAAEPMSAAERAWAVLRLYRDDVRQAVQAGREMLEKLVGSLGLAIGTVPVHAAAAPMYQKVKVPPRTLQTFDIADMETLAGLELRVRLIEDEGVQTISADASWDDDDAHAEPADREITFDLFVLSEHGNLSRHRLVGSFAFERSRGTAWIARTALRDVWQREDDEVASYVEAGDTAFMRVVASRVVS